ncbi:malto-oligosyltrehalose trehalohydrolase [Piscinibacter sp.]|uniref:malto-oligosyltrehalose trehalohydrolase n=1 Tax=Piscinibacter sp. TaxID=1903157 RepID=UPI002C6D491A|nr:malto-oligosyltrehalose trehalohydrolase [Albitalea sp.]HUG24050.1 malto-oligosyltrehalose trehalohydrolase [Albitalea sp.]
MTAGRAHDMPFGAAVQPDGATRFRLWAPSQQQVVLEIVDGGAVQAHPMKALAGGWHERVLDDAAGGTRYRFRLDSGLAVPDPASRFNPDDVHGASMVVDPRGHAWRDTAWRGRPWHEAVVYELHVGTFTPEGTFVDAARRLPDLAALGITAIELMPVADFPGRRNWGYDGVLPFAPDAAYGTPDELKALIQVAHGLNMMVLLDVVYNHFGPDGNYLHAYCPSFFNPQRHTPWGAAINFDGADSRSVRDFFIHNALYWIEEFHLDGLRLDAVHAMHDGSPEHIASEIARTLRDGPGRERPVHVVLENDANQASLLQHAAAQWNDDLHHAAHVLLTGETDGYYADYADAPLARFGLALAEGFVYQGEASPFRGGAPRGEPSTQLAPTAFVSSLQTHDQVGNRALGERIAMLADPARLDAAYACLLLSPHVPMLFMGEEFDASTPFLYFCDFEGELAAAVTHGRREEFGRFAAFADPAARERIPDPNDPATLAASCLRWDERGTDPHARRLAQTGELLALRARHLMPRLRGMAHGGRHRVDGDVLRVEWTLGDGSRWHLVAHFGAQRQVLTELPPGEIVYRLGMDGDAAAPGGVCVALEARDA